MFARRFATKTAAAAAKSGLRSTTGRVSSKTTTTTTSATAARSTRGMSTGGASIGSKSCVNGSAVRSPIASLPRSIVTRANAMGMAGNPALMSMCLEALANATGLMEEDGEEDKPGHGRSSGV